MLNKRFLHGMKPPLSIRERGRGEGGRQSLDGHNLCSMCARRRDETCHHSVAIQEHSTCATLAFRAALFRAHQTEVLAQITQDGCGGRDSLHGLGYAI